MKTTSAFIGFIAKKVCRSLPDIPNTVRHAAIEQVAAQLMA